MRQNDSGPGFVQDGQSFTLDQLMFSQQGTQATCVECKGAKKVYRELESCKRYLASP